MSLLTRLRKLNEKATKGPWEADGGDSYAPIRDNNGNWIADCALDDPDSMQGKINAELIALMRNNIDKLLDVVEAAQDALDDCDRMFRTTTRLQEALQALEREQ